MVRYIPFLISFFINAIAFSQVGEDAIKVIVSSSDLSEDFSVVSSKSDELMLFVYDYTNSKELNEPAMVKKFNFSKGNMEIEFDWNVQNEVNNYILFLIELDSDNNELQIDPILRIHYTNLIEAYEKRNYLGIEKYLGDDDLLGYAKFSIPSTQTIKGVYKLDKFHYTITFQD
ncbi:hypothetical protein [Ekhidna sp.]